MADPIITTPMGGSWNGAFRVSPLRTDDKGKITELGPVSLPTEIRLIGQVLLGEVQLNYDHTQATFVTSTTSVELLAPPPAVAKALQAVRDAISAWLKDAYQDQVDKINAAQP